MSAYVIWGILPFYWKMMGPVPPTEILAWRVVSGAMVVWTIILFRGQIELKKLLTFRAVGMLMLAAVLISINWGIYVWSVATDRLLEAGLGYYINPLVNVVLGVVFLSERLGPVRLTALGFATGGVLVMTLAAGVFPWTSLALACSFGCYGLIMKKMPGHMNNMEILAWILLLLSPVALTWMISLGFRGEWHFTGNGNLSTALLLLAGVPTFLPLWLFGVGARRLPLGTIGFLQYIAPTMMVSIGVFVYGEPFGLIRGISFALVAIALGLYTSTLFKPARVKSVPNP